MPESTNENDRVSRLMRPDCCAVDSTQVAVIIPSWDANRSGNLPMLRQDLLEQSLCAAEVEIVERTSPNGHARNTGVSRTHGEIVVFLDDDVRLGTKEVVRTFAEYLLMHSDVGIVGTSQLLPPDSSNFQRRCASQLSRSQSPIVEDLTDSDMVTTQCCAMRRSVLTEVGGFHDQILRGVDPELRYRVRQAGYRVAVVPNAWHYHPMPATVRSLVRMAWRDGEASAYARKHFPETILFNPEGHVGEFEPRRSFPKRIAGNLGRLVQNAMTGKWQGMTYGLVYAFSNLVEGVKNRP